ncbi:MAG: beta-L-arabinofuranosidase domain-containing protein [Eubacteriales bacterium]
MSEIIQVSEKELDTRIQKNFKRLGESYYQIENVFQEQGADWPGDKEGRALLSFVCHYKISGQKIPCMDLMVSRLGEKTNGDLYFGHTASSIIFEQQLSGHSWYLRGLCEYYQQFADGGVLEALRSTVDCLFLPTRGRYATYPIDRTQSSGGVSGSSTDIVGGWKLSSDIGCAFMSIDGLSHYYEITKDERVLELLDEMIDVFAAIDKEALQAQTHCSLTAARGMLRLYKLTGRASYLEKATAVFDLYTGKGMSLTYQNLNWWGRPDTWTEPCAVVDSLMVALELYKITGDERSRTLAARIFHNGFSTIQRYNGGAGTDTVVYGTQDILRADMYEAFFCCTMRLAEGLYYVRENKSLLYAQSQGSLERDEYGRYMDGDILYAEVSGEGDLESYLDGGSIIEKDGHRLSPVLKLYDVPDEVAMKVRQRILFR